MGHYPLDTTDPMLPLQRRTADELRAFYETSPTVELRHALWEIRRLQNMALDILGRLEAHQSGAGSDQVSWVIERLRQEPCVDEAKPVNYKKRYQESIVNSGRHWGKETLANAEARRRGEASNSR